MTYSLMFTTYSLIMAQVEFGIISIVGKNVVESELKLQIFVQFLMYYKLFGSIFDILQKCFTKWR